MLPISRLSLVTLTLAGCALGGLGGCSTGQDRNAATTKATAAVPVDATKAKQDLSLVVTSLKHVQESGAGADLGTPFRELKSRAGVLRDSLSDLESSSKTAISSGKDQINEWRTQANGLTDANLRTASNAREASLRQLVDSLVVSRGSFMTTNAAYLIALDQAVIALDLDLTPNGVTSIKPTIAKLLADEEVLRTGIQDVADKSQAVHAAVKP